MRKKHCSNDIDPELAELAARVAKIVRTMPAGYIQSANWALKLKLKSEKERKINVDTCDGSDQDDN